MKDEVMFFELVGAGGHTEGNMRDGNAVEYKKGDIIKSSVDLEKKFGRKFRRISDELDIKKIKDTALFQEMQKFTLSDGEQIISPPKNIKSVGDKRLSILICSIKNRKQSLERLLSFLEKQKTNEVEILVEIDNGNISTGEKRNILLNKAIGDYIVFVDDDDEVSVNYIPKILEALKSSPDCCGIKGLLIRKDRVSEFFHSVKHEKWSSKNGKYFRCPNHLNPVRRDLALQIGFLKIDKGEDRDYSLRLQRLLKTENEIKGILYYYIKTELIRK